MQHLSSRRVRGNGEIGGDDSQRGAGIRFCYALEAKGDEPGGGVGIYHRGNKILTNAHNVSNNKYLELQKEGVAKRYPAKVAFIGHDCDLAVLTVDDKSFFDDTAALELAELPGVNTTV